MPKSRVAVIGAGAAGLCSARHLAADPDHFEFVVFEQSGEIGGTWVYTEKTDSDSYGVRIHSSMYKNLKTNIPKEIMPFPDFPFHDTDSSFVHHTDVLKYLKDYAQHFDLYKHIRLRTQVKQVTPTCSSGGVQWSVTVKDVQKKQEEQLIFDAVVVCNGHFTIPYKPGIDGMDQFKGIVMHSKDYRDPEIMRGLRVVILGASSSGVDIAMEVSEVAEKVYLSHKNPEPLTCKLPANVTQLPGVKSASKEGFTFLDESSVEADAFIYCTGYLFSFPFLTPECKVHVEGHRVMPLYKHIIHTELPTLCFIGLPTQILPFPLFHYQIQYFMKTLDGTITLPTKEEMDEETERDLQKRLAMAMPPHDAHKMGSLQWDYFGELASSMGMDSLPPVVRMLYDYVADQRKQNLMNYKKEAYQLLDHGSFERKQVGP